MELLLWFFSARALNFVIGYAIIFRCMHLMGLSPSLGNILSYLIGLTLPFPLNRSYLSLNIGSA